MTENEIIAEQFKIIQNMQERIDVKNWEYERNLVLNIIARVRNKIVYGDKSMDEILDLIESDIRAMR